MAVKLSEARQKQIRKEATLLARQIVEDLSEVDGATPALPVPLQVASVALAIEESILKFAAAERKR